MSEIAKTLVVKGVFWNALQLIINTGFTFGIRLALAKLLLPAEFGIIGMAIVFTGLVQVINDMGISSALIQKKEDSITDVHYQTAFWTGAAVSFSLYIVVSFAVAPIAAWFYNEPILATLIPVISLGIVVSPLNLIHKAKLIKTLNFKRIAIIDNIANVVAGSISLFLAFSNFGVWSLAFNSFAAILIAVPLYFSASAWRPKFIWEKSAFDEIFGFGIFSTITNIVNYLMENMDYFLIGKLLGSASLGSYTFAFTLTDVLRAKLMAVVNNVMYPIYGKNQGNPESLKRFYLRVVNYNSIIIYPIMIVMQVLAEPIILDVFGAKWSDAISPLKILCVSVMVHMLVNSNTVLIRGMGKPALEMRLQILKSLVYIPTVAIGIHLNGIIGAAFAVLCNKAFAVFLAMYTFNKLLKINIGVIEFLNAIKVPVLASISAYCVGFSIYGVGNLHYIFVGIITLFTYMLVVILMMHKEIMMGLKQFKLLNNK